MSVYNFLSAPRAGGCTMTLEEIPNWYFVGRSANRNFIAFYTNSTNIVLYMRWPGRLERILGMPTYMTLIEWRERDA